MPLACGIDLGTTYSAISWYDSYNNRVDTLDLESADGDRVLRSVVYYPGEGEPAVVGQTAWNSAKQFPDRVIVGIKRSMGMDYETQEIDGVRYTPQQVSAEILKTLAEDAQLRLGEEVNDVIITVPAYFGDAERSATEEAGQLAGLNVLGLLPEPHAAALAYGVEKVTSIEDKNLLVFDLGGGTLDVTLMHTATSQDAENALNLEFKTLCKEGFRELGGMDWDRALAEIVAEKIMDEHDVDIWENPTNTPLLLDNCERAKRDLSRTARVSVVADLMGHQAEVSVAEFEDRTRDLVVRAEGMLEDVFEQAEAEHGLARGDIEVMLAGGSTRMPMIREMIEAYTGAPPLQFGNPELLVTMGAAYWAYLLQPDATLQVQVTKEDGTTEETEVRASAEGLTDISSDAVGVEVLRPDGDGGVKRCNAVVLPKGTPSNEKAHKVFEAAEDGMKEIAVVLYKGDSEEIADCEKLKTFTISIPDPGVTKGTRVDVTLYYDDSLILRGEAVVETGETIDIEVE